MEEFRDASPDVDLGLYKSLFINRPSSNRSYRDGVMSAPPVDRGISVEDVTVKDEDDEIKSPDETVESENTFHRLQYNSKALSRSDSTYKLETFQKNYLVVFNQENIEGYAPRAGTEKDVEALERTFSQYGFEVQVHTDLTKSEILEALKVCKLSPKYT